MIDLRDDQAVITVSSVSSLGFQIRDYFVQSTLLPILFGAAWKVLDVLVERAWQADGGPAKPSIESKVKHASETWQKELAPVFNGAEDLAERAAQVYRGTKELRHALTHRRISAETNGVLSDPEKSAYLNREELNAICQFALALTSCVKDGFTSRSRSGLAWWLNQLQRVHSLAPILEAHAPRAIDIVQIKAWRDGSKWYVDTDRAHTKARNTNNGYPYAALHVFSPNGEFEKVETPLEDAPCGNKILFNPAATAPWPDSQN